MHVCAHKCLLLESFLVKQVYIECQFEVLFDKWHEASHSTECDSEHATGITFVWNQNNGWAAALIEVR